MASAAGAPPGGASKMMKSLPSPCIFVNRIPLILPVKCGVASRNPRVGFVSLGCPKALVDSERILTQLRARAMTSRRPTTRPTSSSSTPAASSTTPCTSRSTRSARRSRRTAVIVTGCLGAKPEKITERIRRSLKVTGPHAYEEVVSAVHEHLPPKHDPFIDLVPPQGVRLTPRHYAYLKISEGCNHRCRFCIIPSMRGDLASRPIDQVLNEAIRLRNAGKLPVGEFVEVDITGSSTTTSKRGWPE